MTSVPIIPGPSANLSYSATSPKPIPPRNRFFPGGGFARYSDRTVARGAGRADGEAGRAHPQGAEDFAPPVRGSGGAPVRDQPQRHRGRVGAAVRPHRGHRRPRRTEDGRAVPADDQPPPSVA